jgi:Zn-dependent peptidase ImmA (M78 family)
MSETKELTEARKKELSKLADFVSGMFAKGNITLLEEITAFEELQVYTDHYEDCFDGMLVYDEDRFHIHINLDRGNNWDTNRGRYSLGHELGHYYINEHRIGLQSGALEPHTSFAEADKNDLIELEADYFAGCLLMPWQKIYYFDGVKKFSLDKLKAISESFKVSLLAAAIRYCQTCIHELMIVVSENNTVKWYERNDHFPKWPFRFRVHGSLPPTTVASEFFTKANSRFTSVETVKPDDWFYPFTGDYRANREMNEQCFYSDGFGYVISLLWFK